MTHDDTQATVLTSPMGVEAAADASDRQTDVRLRDTDLPIGGIDLAVAG